jgi:hypothetical protein
VVSFTLRPLYLQEKSPWHPLDDDDNSWPINEGKRKARRTEERKETNEKEKGAKEGKDKI